MARRKGARQSQTQKVEPRPVSPMTELGATGLKIWGGLIDEEFLRQLQGERLIKAMREMSENDEIVGAMLYAIEMLLRQVTWTVEPGGTSPQDQEAADYLESIPEDMSHTWSDFISEWMATPVFGFGPFEVVYKRREGDQRDPSKRSRHNDGRIGVRKIAIRHPDTVLRWLTDDAGGIQGIEQSAPPHYRLTRIPVEKMLLFRIQSRKGNPEGRSILRNAYVGYIRKKRIQEIEAIGIERDLGGIPILWVPPQWMHANAAPEDKALYEEAKRIARNLRNDEAASLVLPLMLDPETNQQLMKIELLGQGGGGRRSAVDTSAPIERYNRGMAMSILADVILIGHEQVGSFALASSKTNLFSSGLAALLDGIEDVMNRHLVPRLMRLNGMQMGRLPRFQHGDVETVDLAELGAYVAQLAGAGAPLFPSTDGELERHLLRAANLPTDGLADTTAVSVDPFGNPFGSGPEGEEVATPDPAAPDPQTLEDAAA